jgi:hypothetical protein
MKKFIIFCSTALIPFIIVWVAFVMTGFSFIPREIFQYGGFWFLSGIYWFLWIAMSPYIMDMINEIHKPTK